nr:MAG TPA: hypothetical protein [Caudoviricetes sp.]
MESTSSPPPSRNVIPSSLFSLTFKPKLVLISKP